MMKKWAAEEAAKNGKKIPVVEEPDSEAEKAAWEKVSKMNYYIHCIWLHNYYSSS